MANKYATVSWTISDIQDIKEDWSEDQCYEFLINNQNIIRDRLIEKGYEIIDDLLAQEDARNKN